METEIIEKPKKARKIKSEKAEPKSTLRDERGLLLGVNYEFDERGFVDWRKVIKSEFVVLNRLAMAKAGIDVKLLSKEENEKHLAEVSDEKKLIKLAGFKDLLRVRGYYSVHQQITPALDGVICQCSITFTPNFETDFNAVTYTSVAHATPSNVSPEFSQFLATIAANRALGRCIREFLNISTVTEEEMNPNEEVKISEPPNKPLVLVKQKCLEKGISFDVLLKELNGRGLSDPSWISFETLGITAALTALESIKSL